MGRTPFGRVKGGFGRARKPDFACPKFLCPIACVTPTSAAHAATPVSKPFRFSLYAWLAIPLCACGFLLWTNGVRVQRIEYVTGLAEQAEPARNASAPAGRAEPSTRLIVPEHDNASYEWLDLTRQMFARGEWRVRRVDFENAPFGREVFASSPYRWWLGLVAWCDHELSGRSLDRAVERAALVADPLLHFLLLLGTVMFVAWRFGGFAAAFLSLGFAFLFPFAAEFLPGVPDNRGLAQACAIWSVLTLLVGASAAHSVAADARPRARRWFFGAGVIGGLGLWIDASHQVPVLAGIALGALVGAWAVRGQTTANPAGGSVLGLWRTWACGGAVTCLAAYLIEYFPSHLGTWELRVIHPLYGLAWLGGGEIIGRALDGIRRHKLARRFRDLGTILLAVATVAAVPVAMRLTHNLGFLEVDLPASRLVRLPEGAVATNSLAWMVREGFSAAVSATVLPVALLGPAIWLLARRATGTGPRTAIAIALGPVVVALGFAWRQLNAWNALDGVWLVLLVATMAALRGETVPRLARWAWSGFAVLLFVPGVIQLSPRTDAGVKYALNVSEVLGLIERDLARWLALHEPAKGSVVLAPHNEAITLYYYGGLRGLATLSWENRDGFGVAMRIVSASTPEEAKELIDRRGVRYLVIPSWDSNLDAYARIGMGKLEDTFLNDLHNWKLPPWLRPVAYQLPGIPGFEGQAVTILEVVEDQDDAAALSWIAEYFVEIGQLDQATAVAQALRRFPADLGALVARAQVELARGDTAEFDRSVELLRSRVASGADRALTWDRRVALAVVLARGKHMDLAGEQVRRCLAQVDEAKLHSLTVGSLYRLLVLGRASGLTITDPKLRERALDLLPADLRNRL